MKRNRAQTEQRIIDAAIAMICESGFSEFGINHVAARSGADKVLIYRYFNGIEGLMERIAREMALFPPAASLFGEDTQDLHIFIRNYRRILDERPLTRALIAWQQAADNPLTAALRAASDQFWQDVATYAQPADEAGQAFLQCLRPILNDSVADAEVLAALGKFSYAPHVPESACSNEEATAVTEPDETELPTNLL